jgi:hypothetical protein
MDHNTTTYQGKSGLRRGILACELPACQNPSLDFLQMVRSHSKRFGILGTARVLLASVLLAAFVGGIVPLASVTAGSACQLECCAGRAPHRSGSCMDGSCQVILLTARAHNHHAKLDRAEKFCGINKAFKSTSLARMRVKPSSHKSLDQIAANAFEKQCQSDCGGCVSGFTNSKRQRSSAASAAANQPRPPAPMGLFLFAHHGFQVLAAQSRQGAPRGPPSSVS